MCESRTKGHERAARADPREVIIIFFAQENAKACILGYPFLGGGGGAQVAKAVPGIRAAQHLFWGVWMHTNFIKITAIMNYMF